MSFYRWVNRFENYYWDKLNDDINDDYVFIESFSSTKIAGELYYVINYILENFPSKKIYLSIKKEMLPREFKKHSGRITIFNRNSKKYYKYLATSKYIFTDTTFGLSFIKRDDQILVNYWHGTPIKKMGILSSKKGHYWNISNVQKTLYLSDWIVFNNRWSKKVFSRDYMLPTLIEENIKILPTLKNHISTEGSKKTKKVLFLYTWKTEYRKNLDVFKSKLIEIDNYIAPAMEMGNISNNEYKFTYSIHNLVYSEKLVNWMNANLKFLKPLLKNRETYRELVDSEIIISDFSSIIFEAAWYKKRILIDKSDISSYKNERGIYDEVWEDLNIFDSFNTVEETINSIFKNIEPPKDLDNFNRKYNEAESNFDIDKYWLNDLLKSESNNLIDLSIIEQSKKDILIFPGQINDVEDLNSIKNLLNNIPKENYRINFWMPKDNFDQEICEHLYNTINRTDINIISSWKKFTGSFLDSINESMYKLYKKRLFSKRYNLYIKKEVEKIFGNKKFDKVISLSSGDNYINNVIGNISSLKIYLLNDRSVDVESIKKFNKSKSFRLYYHTNFNNIKSSYINDSAEEKTILEILEMS